MQNDFQKHQQTKAADTTIFVSNTYSLVEKIPREQRNQMRLTYTIKEISHEYILQY